MHVSRCHTRNCSRTRELSVNLSLCKFKPCFDYQHADTTLASEMIFLIKALGIRFMAAHLAGHHLASSRCLPQVWLRGGVLDLLAAYHFRVHPWNHLCRLYHYQVIDITLFFMISCYRWRDAVPFDPIKKFLVV
ncbi:hypothetical protein Peur_027276 [Populus x canadensis]